MVLGVRPSRKSPPTRADLTVTGSCMRSESVEQSSKAAGLGWQALPWLLGVTATHAGVGV